MTADQRFFGLCALVYGALFLAALFVAGLVTNHSQVWKSALISMAAAFLCFVFQLWGKRYLALFAMVMSWASVAGTFMFVLFDMH